MKKILPSTLLFLATSSTLLRQEETYNRTTGGLWDEPTQWTSKWRTNPGKPEQR
jgi:hypothetical protein